MPRMTNKQLARWVTMGKGEVCVAYIPDHPELGMVQTYYTYNLKSENLLVPANIKIRPIGSNVWLEPELEEVPHT